MDQLPMNDSQNTPETPVEASIAQEGDHPTPPGKSPVKPRKRKGARKGKERAAKAREYHARLIAEGKPEQAAKYREGREWAWQWLRSSTVDAQSLAQAAVDSPTAGGEGVKAGASVESGINSLSSPKIVAKDISDNELSPVSSYSGAIQNKEVLSPLTFEQETYIREIVRNAVSLAFKAIRREDPHQDTTKEEPKLWEDTKVPVVWPVDGDEAFEVTITGAPPNKSMRLVKREGDEEVYQMWCNRDLWPMVGWRVACKPSDDPERPGLVLLGVYNRGGLRVE